MESIRAVAIPESIFDQDSRLEFYSQDPKTNLHSYKSSENDMAATLLFTANFRLITCFEEEVGKPELTLQGISYTGFERISRLVTGIEAIRELLPLITGDDNRTLPNLTIRQILRLVRQNEEACDPVPPDLDSLNQ